MFKIYIDKFRRATVVEKLIVINVVIFIITFTYKTVCFLLQIPESSVLSWLVFPADIHELLRKPWTLFTYAFLHDGFFHLLFNMLVLYFSGNFFLTYFAGKRLLNFYFLGAFAGALVFLLSYNLFPAFSNTGEAYLLGASAGVMAVLIGIATHIPYMGIRLLLLGSVKLWHIAVFFVILDIIMIPFGNGGGRLAHLGGALLGFTYVKMLDRGVDIGKWWETFIGWITGLFVVKKQKPLKTVHRNKNTNKKTETSYSSKTNNQKKIDMILDKISKSGYDSLSKEEKDFLFKAGNN